MNRENTPNRVSWRVIGAIVVILLIFAVLLMLDLSNHGLAWQFFWSKTGEEAPLAQIRGMVEWLGDAARPPLETAPFSPVNHTDEIPYGINTFLQKEVEEPKIRAMLRMIKDAGFVWLRQEFPWEDLEVDGRGQFTDSRNDYTGDGVKDTVDAWEKYDQIVDLTGDYGLKLIVRLSNPPAWSRENNPDTLAGALAPPDDLQDFVNYASAVAERYKGRIHHYQVWNEPNIYPEWGENFVSPERYTELLCRTYEALKSIDPEIVVISGALAPTNALDGYFGYSDVIFLQNMYDYGAGDCFDVLSVQGYGLFSGPTDQRTRFTSANYARQLMIRDVMVKNGDADKSIWLSEAAWNPVLDAERPQDEIADFNRFGTVTNDQAARYMPIAYQRAQEEWPWVGVINYWFFTRPDPFENDQSFFYFRMVEPDYQPEKPTFTPLPVYNTMKDYIAETYANPVLYPGVHQAETWQTTKPDSATSVKVEGAQFDEALQTESLRFTASGTHIQLRWQKALRGTNPARITINGETHTITSDDSWQTAQFSTDSAVLNVEIEAESPIFIDAITVINRSAERQFATFAPLIAVGVIALGVLASALWKRIRS